MKKLTRYDVKLALINSQTVGLKYEVNEHGQWVNTGDVEELEIENDKLSKSLDSTMISLGKAYQEVEKWKEEYRVTEKARASFETAAVSNMKENVQLKLERAQELHGEQVKSGEFLIRQLRGFKVDCLIAEGRSTVMTPDELDAYDPVASLREKTEKIKELERQKVTEDQSYEFLKDEFRQLKADHDKFSPIRKALEGIPGPLLLAWTVCQLQNVETFAKAVLKYRKAKESQ